MGALTLVTGGARSGKSAFAERLATEGRGPVVYVATATVDPADPEMVARVAAHRRGRPADWRTIEAPSGLGERLVDLTAGTVLLDDLGLLVTTLLFDVTDGGEPSVASAERLDRAVADELAELSRASDRGGWDLVVVTNEVGSGVVPATPVGRVFRDALGRANQALAVRADAVYLLVAGIPLRVR
jgi:adenosylcobinamide kinase / adenosylcobinamide-phosphate guanylyltransferase